MIIHDLHDSQMFAIAQAAGRAGIPIKGTFWPMERWEKSRYIRDCVELPCLGEQLKGTYALSLKNSGFSGVWLPCVDDMADFTARYQEMLRNIGFKFITADAETITSAFTTESLPETSILKVASMQLVCAIDLYENAGEYIFPLMLKSVRDGFRKFDDAQTLRSFLESEGVEKSGEHYHRVQQYIEGGIERMASAILLFDEDSRPVRGFTGRRLRVAETHFGPYGETTAGRAEWIPELYEGARELLAALNWKGFAEVECKQGEDGHWYVMEINPRLSGWTPLAEADGAGLLSAYYQICADGVKLDEACLQRSKAEYVRMVATSYHDPDWAVEREGNRSLTSQIGNLISIIKAYRQRRPNMLLGAWDDLDRPASRAIFQSTMKRFWKKRRVMSSGRKGRG